MTASDNAYLNFVDISNSIANLAESADIYVAGAATTAQG
jgi:hypothetical protein